MMFDQGSSTVRFSITGVLRLDRPMTVLIGLTSLNKSLNINTSQSRRRGINRSHLTNQADHGPVEDQHAEVLPEAIPGEATTT